MYVFVLTVKKHLKIHAHLNRIDQMIAENRTFAKNVKWSSIIGRVFADIRNIVIYKRKMNWKVLLSVSSFIVLYFLN